MFRPNSITIVLIDLFSPREIATGRYTFKEEEVCGSYRWGGGLKRWAFDCLRRAAEAGFIPLLREADALRRQRFWCRREGCWVHLLDWACSLWEPAWCEELLPDAMNKP